MLSSITLISIDYFGISAKYIDFNPDSPKDTHNLSSLKTLMSGSSAIKEDICNFWPDLISCFVLGNPTLPVWRGEIQCKGLGMDIAVFDDWRS